MFAFMENYSIKEHALRILRAVDTIETLLSKDMTWGALDITKPQLVTLIAISKKKCCTMTELGKLTGYATTALTGIVDRLVRKKLVQRIRDEKDRRIVKVTVTERGSELAAGLVQKMSQCTELVLEKLQYDEREKLVSLIETIATELCKPNAIQY